jgi:hypothetical protein
MREILTAYRLYARSAGWTILGAFIVGVVYGAVRQTLASGIPAGSVPPPPSPWMASLQVLLSAGLVAAILTRRLDKLCYSFPLYLLGSIVSTLLLATWSDGVFDWQLFLLQHAVDVVLRLAVGIELSVRLFRSFPAVTMRARGIIVFLVTMTTLAIVAVPSEPGFLKPAAEILPRVATGSIWLFTATTLLIAWYRIPVHPFQKAILIGFAVYLLLFATGFNVVRDFGAPGLELFAYTQPAAVILVLAFWLRAAWIELTAHERIEVPASGAYRTIYGESP